MLTVEKERTGSGAVNETAWISDPKPMFGKVTTKFLREGSPQQGATRLVTMPPLESRSSGYYDHHMIRRQPTIERTFQDLVTIWREETGMLSSPVQKAIHRAYLEIIGLGPIVLPLIFRELRDRGGHWFYALEAITHFNPVPPGAEGDTRCMKAAWLSWGTMHGYI